MATLYYGNTIEQWALFLLCVAAGFILGKIINYIVKNHLKRLALRTKTELDDILLGAFETPLLVITSLSGLWIGKTFLTLEPELEGMLVHVIGAVITAAIAWFLVNLVDGFVYRFLKKFASKTASKMDDQLLPIISKSLKVVVVILAIIVIADNFFGVDVTGPLLGLGIGGVAIAFAAQATIADVFGGISIFTSKPFQVGDDILFEGMQGKIEEVGLRHTRMRNLEGRVVTIPNSKLANSVIENISTAPSRRILLNLGLTYDTSAKRMEKAKSIVTEIIQNHPGCDKEPLLVFFSEFKDFSLNLLVIYFIHDLANWGQVRSEINFRIKEAFDKEKLDFAFPTQTIHMVK